MSHSHRHFHRLAWAAVVLALGVILLGAFTRLSNAGLSCPDWPTCYGHVTWPEHAEEVAAANKDYTRAVETHKAWREQVHRMMAGTLGLLVLTLAALATRGRRYGWLTVFGASALIAAAIPTYIAGHHVAAAVLAAIGELALLIAALRWSNADFARLATLTLAVIVFQALLGMWTVTWLLKPIVVMGHLLGGMTTFSLLVWLAWRATPNAALIAGDAPRLLRLGMIAIVLVAMQIALGGWVSANYAALACGTDFPTCLGRWWPQTDFREALVLWRGIGVDYEGGVLDAPARTAIQLMHRLFALLVFGHVLVYALRLRRTPGIAGWGWLLGLLLGAQVALGISNIVFAVPLAVATLHNAGAALLLFVLVSLQARLQLPRSYPPVD